MQIFVLCIHVLVALGIIGLVLLQHGKGADMGAAFGAGGAGGLFGASGASNFLSRTTAILTFVFFVTSLTLTYLSTGKSENKGVVLGQPTDATTTSAPSAVPATSAPATSDAAGKAKEIPK
jgi:preprotein translocase subunit SecG